jgi:hypothetical protein
LAQGKVELILEEFELPKIPIVAVSAPSKLPETKTRLFIDLLAARLKQEPYL